MRCFLLENPGCQLERCHVLVAKLTHLAAAIPLPTRLFHLFPQLHLGKADVHHYNGGACGDASISLSQMVHIVSYNNILGNTYSYL